MEWNTYHAQTGPSDLSQADLAGEDLKDYNFSRCALTAAKMANCDLTGADLSEANLSYADLKRANLARANLSKSNLQVAQLAGANLVEANLEGADLRSAKLNGAYLAGANLAGANIENADLRAANLKFAKAKGAILDRANVEDADLTGFRMDAKQSAGLLRLDRAIIRPTAAAKAKAALNKKLMPHEDYEDLFAEADCYKILGVTHEANLETIERAYKQRVKEYHPDRVNTLGEKLKVVALREFHRIQAAYQSLMIHRSSPPAPIGASAGGKTPVPQKHLSEYTAEDYQAIAKANPQSDAAYYNLGLKLFQRGLVDNAIEAYQHALALNPNNHAARHNLKLAELAKNLAN